MVLSRSWVVWVVVGCAFAVSMAALGATLRVPEDYPTIQAAINAASPGDTIVVAAGTYTENLNITKSVTISGAGADSVILQPAVAGYGIEISGAGNTVKIENLTIVAGNAKHFLLHVSGISNFTIQNVKIIGAGKTATPHGYPLGGVDLNFVASAVIRNVEVWDVSRNGIALTNSTVVTLEDIDVHDTGVSEGWAGVAIYTTVAGNFSVTFAGTNAVANTPMGIYVMDTLGAVVNLTAPAGTIAFSGQSVAPLAKLGQGSTPNLDSTALGLGLVGKVYAPESPTPPYNTGAAFYATVAEALMAAVVDPVQARYAVVFDLASNRFVVGPGMQIQRALNAAQTGDTVLVSAGEYVTQGLIEKSLVLLGAPGAVIKAPGSQTYTIAESSRTFDPIIFAFGGTMVGSHVSGPEVISAAVKGLVMDGQNKAQPHPIRFVGILYRNVHGEISGNVIQNMMNPGGVGAGAETFGILAYGDSVVDIIGNVISDYSRGGIGVLGDVVGWMRGPARDPVANIMGNLVTGNGLEAATGWWAENGIQMGYGASGQIVGNIVSNHWVNNPDWVATGILAVSADNVNVRGNYVVNNQLGIGVMGLTPWGGEAANQNSIVENTIVDGEYGISLQYDALSTTIARNVLSGNYIAIDGFGWGGAEPVGAVIRFNSIAGNTYGVVNSDPPYAVVSGLDAALNWWGSPKGPTAETNPGGDGDAIYGDVIYSPWLGTDPDGDLALPGVQITGPVTIIVAPVGPEPTVGYLNQAIAGANDLPFADTIKVRAGTHDASTPVTDSVNIGSCASCPSMATLTGTLSLQAAGIFLGRMGEGFTIQGDITVGAGVDASTVHIHWNDLYGNVTNAGTGWLDATYNWWGGRRPSAATFGRVNYYPYLPLPVCDMLAYMDRMGVDADTAIFLIERGGLVSEGLLVLGLMQRFGLSRDEAEKVVDDFGFLRVGCAFDRCADYDEFVRLLLGFGVASLGVADSYKVGEPINIAYDLVGFQGNPVPGIGAWVTLVQIHDGGRQTVWRWGATQYKPETGKQELSISTSGLPAGNYELIIGFKDGSHEKLVTKLVVTE